MNRTKLRTYAPQARRDFIQAVTDRAAFYGLTKNKTEQVTEEGDVAIIGGKPFPRHIAAMRKTLEERSKRQGFEQVMEAMAYTWFNRLMAIRFMELHGYLDHGYRVLSHPEGSNTPEIVEHAEHVELPGLDKQKVIDLKLEGTKEAELYEMLLLAQCHALHQAMPFLFETIDDETELLLPDNLLHSDSLIRRMVGEIDEEDWQEVEIIGWLYQFYISEKKDEVIGKVVRSEDIPAATQLFTPNWIVKYLVQNSLGRQWVATHPNSPLKGQMEYYIEPAEQTPEVQAQLREITPDSLNPEELTLLDPACGSGHILVEAYDLLKAIYQERGYRAKDIPRLILDKNLFGLEICDRSAQLAAFALMMKARADDRRIFAAGIQPNVSGIQESKGLDAREITVALNQPIFKGEAPPPESLFEEIDDDKAPLFSRKNLAEPGQIPLSDVAQLIDLFEHGKTFGSLVQVPENLAGKLPAIAQRVDGVRTSGGLFSQSAARAVEPLVDQARLLAAAYTVLTTNPPYMGSNYQNPLLKTFVKSTFAGFDKDLYSAFMVRCRNLVEANGTLGFMSPFTWMFIPFHEKLRTMLVGSATLTSLIQLEYSGFAEATVPICAFTFQKDRIPSYLASFIRLTDFKGPENQRPKTLEAIANPNCGWCYTAPPDDFKNIPGTPIAYWASRSVIDAFTHGVPLGEVAKPRTGLNTTDNATFVRLWHEVDYNNINFASTSLDDSGQARERWYPFQKGGDFRKWYGNHEYVVNWRGNGEDIKSAVMNNPRDNTTTHWSRRIFNTEFFFMEGVTWSTISSSDFSARYFGTGFIISNAAGGIFPDRLDATQITALTNSSVPNHMFNLLNPTLNYSSGLVAQCPVMEFECDRHLVSSAVAIAKADWDMSENSWEFQRFPLLSESDRENTLGSSWASWESRCHENIHAMREIECKNNQVFFQAYGLAELSPEVPEEKITLYRPDREEDLQRFISYAIGCMMGRYSLDRPGLIYARSGNHGFDPSQYRTFPADKDGIIPVTDTAWFDDDAANRLVQFISVAWPEEHLQENLTFIAESLGPKKGESPRETIRRYLSQGFFKHHLKMYKKRPIYWLFSSGKAKAFECLVYLHRYNKGTLSRMRTEYVIPLQGKIDARIDQLKDDIAAATSTSHGKKLQKERDKLVKQQAELQLFDEKLRHYADQRISLDLDDGVKVNYGKFGDLLAEVTAVAGKRKKG